MEDLKLALTAKGKGELRELLSVAVSEKENFRFFIFENCKKY